MKMTILAAVGLAAGALVAEAEIDPETFAAPPRAYRPETWFHFINGNVSKPGITADLEAIASAGISAVTFFHGGNIGIEPWPGTDEQIPCLSPKWEEHVRFVADEAKRLGLGFKMQNCPGWSMAGGPWIGLDNAMREIDWTATAVEGGKVNVKLPVPPVPACLPTMSLAERDFRDLRVLAFPEVKGADATLALARTPIEIASNDNWQAWSAECASPFTVRTVELPSPQSLRHLRSYSVDVTVRFAAELDGKWCTVRTWRLPKSNWQDESPLSLAVPDVAAKRFQVTFDAGYPIKVSGVRLLGWARPDAWEGESGVVLRALMRNPQPQNAAGSYVEPASVCDLTKLMKADGTLVCALPPGRWTVLRVGHANLGRTNGPAPKEATGWECDKLSPKGIEANFDGYIGRLTAKGGVLEGRLDGMILDSWECKTQNWTPGLDRTFAAEKGYSLEKWWPALCGYVVGDRKATAEFFRDWRGFLGDQIAKNFYGRMSELAHARGLTVDFETAMGDVVPGDILSYWKGADEVMCEFWRVEEPDSPVNTEDFKPIRPARSAARLYGKNRVTAEALTGGLTWAEALEDFKECLDRNLAAGVTHPVFQTYTHNPGYLPPGSTFGAWAIGSPFLRGQTWWKHMRLFTDYVARCGYLLEAGRPKCDVLVDLGDDVDHVPPKRMKEIPEGYDYDYVNPEGRATCLVQTPDGSWVTKAGLRYAVMWRRGDTKTTPAKLLAAAGVAPDVTFAEGRAPWIHRGDAKCDWYFIAVAPGEKVKVRLREANPTRDRVEIWNPRTGAVERPVVEGGAIVLAESAFVVSAKDKGPTAVATSPGKGNPKLRLEKGWTLRFAPGWGREETLKPDALAYWNELPGSREAKAYSGDVRYETSFEWTEQDSAAMLALPDLKGIAVVKLNGQPAGAIWTRPNELPLAGLKPGKNTLEITVTSPWHNRLVYDQSLPVKDRKTWTYGAPDKAKPFLPFGFTSAALH